MLLAQVWTYAHQAGCSVRIGVGIDRKEPLDQKQCTYYEFVETVEGVQAALDQLKRLPDTRVGKEESLVRLKKFLEIALAKKYKHK